MATEIKKYKLNAIVSNPVNLDDYYTKQQIDEMFGEGDDIHFNGDELIKPEPVASPMRARMLMAAPETTEYALNSITIGNDEWKIPSVQRVEKLETDMGDIETILKLLLDGEEEIILAIDGEGNAISLLALDNDNNEIKLAYMEVENA